MRYAGPRGSDTGKSNREAKRSSKKTAEQKVTWSKKRIRDSGGDIQNQNDGYQNPTEGR